MERHLIYPKSNNTAIEIAKHIVHKCINEGCPISNLQLQKILYFIQKSFLKENNRMAFSDRIEAWKFGPVVPEVYYRYSGFGAMPITIELSSEISLNPDDKQKIDEIVEKLRNCSPWELVEITHRPGGAWDQTVKTGCGFHDIIPISAIKEEE